jgi:hypothetical protein
MFKRSQPARAELTAARSILVMLVTSLTIMAASAWPVGAEEAVDGRTPPRVSLVDGDVSFWRPGTDHWAPAEVNLPLAPGDLLETGPGANLELQVGAQAFVRAGQGTRLGVESEEPDYLQLKISAGHLALDVRELRRGHTFEIETPNAILRVEHPGYYRVAASEDATRFIARRGGRATVTPSGGTATEAVANDEVWIEGKEAPSLAVAEAGALDDWDRWNYERTDDLLNSESTRYVSEDVYGAEALDGYGYWASEPIYGNVWVPTVVSAGWAPYTNGRWIWDPYYAWTWLDGAPWGWVPYHYGRWVHTGARWAWAPGPIVTRLSYAPALVAFFGSGGFRADFGWPFIGWVPLGWGEPLVPWWGPPGFVGKPCWRGWAGPRVSLTHFGALQNAHVPNALVAVPGAQFGRLRVDRIRISGANPRQLQPVRGALPVRPSQGRLAMLRGGTVPFPPASGQLPPLRRTLSPQRPTLNPGSPPRVLNAGARPLATDQPRVMGRAQQPVGSQALGASSGVRGRDVARVPGSGVRAQSPPPRGHVPRLPDQSATRRAVLQPPMRPLDTRGVSRQGGYAFAVPSGPPPAPPLRTQSADVQSMPPAPAPRRASAAPPRAVAGPIFRSDALPQRPYVPGGSGVEVRGGMGGRRSMGGRGAMGVRGGGEVRSGAGVRSFQAPQASGAVSSAPAPAGGGSSAGMPHASTGRMARGR